MFVLRITSIDDRQMLTITGLYDKFYYKHYNANAQLHRLSKCSFGRWFPLLLLNARGDHL